ncbi:rRNA pseudouridine synthase, partial [Burkholderia pseudomallei]|nr:rRNA pseudouridine synthase [Burkholderia pseudomallei]
MGRRAGQARPVGPQRRVRRVMPPRLEPGARRGEPRAGGEPAPR